MMGKKIELSIITINRNNASGLENTINSVLSQTYPDFEYIVVDGASSDGSVKIIEESLPSFQCQVKWMSEPDRGIYNAMNKGISIASGIYVQFLNSGDSLVSNDVVQRMIDAIYENEEPSILYGNMLKKYPDGRVVRDVGFAGQGVTLLGMYSGTLNHDPAFIKRELFFKYGLYDEDLKISSDWEWYLKTIVFGGERPVYRDIDVTFFDMTGVSENLDSKEIIRKERRYVLEKELPFAILQDYDRYHSDIYTMRRIHRHPFANKFVWLVERVLFKLEKIQNKNKNVQRWG